MLTCRRLGNYDGSGSSGGGAFLPSVSFSCGVYVLGFDRIIFCNQNNANVQLFEKVIQSPYAACVGFEGWQTEDDLAFGILVFCQHRCQKSFREPVPSLYLGICWLLFATILPAYIPIGWVSLGFNDDFSIVLCCFDVVPFLKLLIVVSMLQLLLFILPPGVLSFWWRCILWRLVVFFFRRLSKLCAVSIVGS
jgi:hypothetical protein